MRFHSSTVRAAFGVAAGIAMASLATPSWAALGGTADSVSADRTALRGMLRSTPQVQYDVQEIDSGIRTVREYLTRAGQVFAVTWHGAAPPDLQQLLGSYFAQAQAATRAVNHAAAHRRFAIAQPGFVLQSVARQRDFHGVAYVPMLVPAGVDVSQLP